MIENKKSVRKKERERGKKKLNNRVFFFKFITFPNNL